MPNLEECPKDIIERIAVIYNEYLEDIESNVVEHATKAYKVNSYKEYKIVKSKSLIDKIDDLVGVLYKLNKNEIEYIKSFEEDIRTGS